MCTCRRPALSTLSVATKYVRVGVADPCAWSLRGFALGRNLAEDARLDRRPRAGDRSSAAAFRGPVTPVVKERNQSVHRSVRSCGRTHLRTSAWERDEVGSKLVRVIQFLLLGA